MKRVMSVVIVLGLTSCATRPVLTDSMLRPADDTKDEVVLSGFEGRVLSVREYPEVTGSYDGDSHLYIEVELLKPGIPRYPKAKVIDCRVALGSNQTFSKGDTVELLFDDENGDFDTLYKMSTIKGISSHLQRRPPSVHDWDEASLMLYSTQSIVALGTGGEVLYPVGSPPHTGDVVTVDYHGRRYRWVVDSIDREGEATLKQLDALFVESPAPTSEP